MFIYRLSPAQYAKDLTGEGAGLFGGRWNNAGTRCVYSSESRALCVLEYTVNVPGAYLPDNLCIVTIEIPDNNHLILNPEQLPNDWRQTDVRLHTQAFGTRLLEKDEHFIIRVPSVVIPEEYNYIINPTHTGIKKVNIVNVAPFSFDTRLKR